MSKLNLVAILFLTGIFASQAQEKTQNQTDKAKQLNEVSIVSQKKAVEQRPDRTIFDFASQSHLNSGSVLEGIKKLPGLVASDLAGMMYQGKQLDVYMD